MTIGKVHSSNKALPFIGIAVCFVLVSFLQQFQGLTCATCLFNPNDMTPAGAAGFDIECRSPTKDTIHGTCPDTTVKYCEKRYLKFDFGGEMIEILSRQCSAEMMDMQQALPVCFDLPSMMNQDAKNNMGTPAITNIQNYLVNNKNKTFESVTVTGKVCLCNAEDVNLGCNKGDEISITDKDGTFIVMTTIPPPSPPTPEGGDGAGERGDGGHDAAGGLFPHPLYSLSAPAFFLGSYLIRSGTFRPYMPY